MPNASIDDDTTALQRAARQADRLLTISLTLNSKMDQKRLLQLIVETVPDVIDCEAASLLVFDEHTRKLRFAAAVGADPNAFEKLEVPLNDSLAGAVFTGNEAIIVSDVANDERHFSAVSESMNVAVQALIGVPLHIEGRLSGVLEGINKRNGEFTEADVDSLSIVAAQAAIAIRHARQTQALNEAYQQLKHSIRMRRALLDLIVQELRSPLSDLLKHLPMFQHAARENQDVHAASLADAVKHISVTLDTLARHVEIDPDASPGTLRDALREALQRVEAANSRKSGKR